MRTTLQERVRLARKSAKERLQLDLPVTQADLAKECGITRNSIWKIEVGETDNPRSKTLNKIAETLRVNIEWLMHGKGAMDPKSPEFDSKTVQQNLTNSMLKGKLVSENKNQILNNQTVVLMSCNADSNKDWMVIIPNISADTLCADLAPSIDTERTSQETIVQSDVLVTVTDTGDVKVFLLNILL